MASVVSICNLALSHIRAGSISSLTEASTEARACNAHYEQARDTLLAMHPWDFAGEISALAEEPNDWVQRYQYRYRLPSDCLKVRRLVPEIDPRGSRDFILPYDLKAGRLYADESPAYLEYTKRITDPTQFPPLFVDALAWHIASRIAQPITGDRERQGDATNAAEAWFLKAAAHDANNTFHQPDYVAESIAARSDVTLSLESEHWLRR